MARRTALERVEDAADERWGRGTAVSVERDEKNAESERVVVRVWSASGAQLLHALGKDRTQACNALLAMLKIAPTFEDA